MQLKEMNGTGRVNTETIETLTLLILLHSKILFSKAVLLAKIFAKTFSKICGGAKDLGCEQAPK